MAFARHTAAPTDPRRPAPVAYRGSRSVQGRTQLAALEWTDGKPVKADRERVVPMRPATLARLSSFALALLLSGCDAVKNPGQPGTQVAAPLAASTPSITILDLGTLGGTFSQAAAINHRGQVVGYSSTAGGGCGGSAPSCHAFLWDHGTMIDLGTLGGTFSRALAINDAGQIAGNSTLPTGSTCPEPAVIDPGCRAFFWDGTMHDLGTLGGDFSEATDITPQGHVVGISTTASSETHAFLWDGATMHDLGTLGGTLSVPRAANAAGRVAGLSTTAAGDFHAFVWDGTTMIDLGTLGGAMSQALAMNPRGDIVGFSHTTLTPDGDAHAFLWDGATMHDLGTLGGEASNALAINPRGDIVGYANTRPGGIGDPHPFLWDGTINDLGTLGGVDGQAMAINERGQVVGQAGLPEFGSCTAVGGCHAFFWDGTTMHDLGDLGFPSSVALDLNTKGQIVGTSQTPSRDTHAVLWTVK